jgi:hypothetical protein
MAFTNSEFVIDGHRSVDLGINGVSIIRLGGESEIRTPWISGQEIIEEKIPYRDIPYLYRVEKQPLEFSIKFSILDDVYSSDVLFNLGMLFGQSKYVEFRTTDFMGKIFYIMRTSSIELITYGSFKGWYEMTVRNCAPYCFSEVEVSTFDFSDITSPTTFEINAKFNVPDQVGNYYYYYPELWVDLKGTSTGFTITNNSDSGRKYGFQNLNLLEEIYVNNRLKQIESSTGNYRLGNMLLLILVFYI